MNIDKSDQSRFDSRAYRDALGCFGTGVCLIATQDDAGKARVITVNSFASVSLDPPIILWSIDCLSDRFRLFTQARHFSVNILRAGDEHLSNEGAQGEWACLADEDRATGAKGVPVYKEALAQFVCETSWRQRAGDHVVIFGAVIDFQSETGDGLGYFRGNYTTIK